MPDSEGGKTHVSSNIDSRRQRSPVLMSLFYTGQCGTIATHYQSHGAKVSPPKFAKPSAPAEHPEDLNTWRVPPDNTSAGRGCGKIPGSKSAQAKLRDGYAAALAQRGVLAGLHDCAEPFEKRIVHTASQIYEFFHANGYALEQADWLAGKIDAPLARYKGWVYAFYGVSDVPIYVGESGRTFVARFREHEKKQKQKSNAWWPSWTRVKVLPCPDQTMRKVFEALIGLAGGYEANIQQPRAGDNIFDEILLSLLILGNNHKRLPIFPKVSDDRCA